MIGICATFQSVLMFSETVAVVDALAESVILQEKNTPCMLPGERSLIVERG